MAEPDCNLMSKEPISAALFGLVRRVAGGLSGWLLADSLTPLLVVLPAISTEYYHCSSHSITMTQSQIAIRTAVCRQGSDIARSEWQ